MVWRHDVTFGMILGIATVLFTYAISGDLTPAVGLAVILVLWCGQLAAPLGGVLDYAADGLVLRRVNGSYVFAPRLLLLHPASTGTAEDR